MFYSTDYPVSPVDSHEDVALDCSSPDFDTIIDLSHIEGDIRIRSKSSVDADTAGIHYKISRSSVQYNGQHSFTYRNASVTRICFIGAGYVGGTTAAVIALYNPSIQVYVVDKNESRINQWNSCHLPIHEPSLDETVRVTRDGALVLDERSSNSFEVVGGHATLLHSTRAPNLFFSTNVIDNIAKAEMIFVAVNTPTSTCGAGAGRATDMASFNACIDEVVQHAKPGTVIVEKSTVPCGTAQRILSQLQMHRPSVSIEVLSNPEFLAEGSAIENLMNPDRVIIGSLRTPKGDAAAQSLAHVYSWVSPEKILTSNAWSSELCKLVANAMLAQRISSINSISAICEETGADINEVERSAGSDVRIGSKFLKSGLGFGGSCFRKDVASLAYLAESLGLDEIADYWNQVNSINNFQRRRFTQKVIGQLDNNLADKRVAILGFAYKKDTSDVRDSLALDVVRMLLEEGSPEITIFDPFCRAADIINELSNNLQCKGLSIDGVKICSDPYAACTNADAVLLLTDCEQFRNSNSRDFREDSTSSVRPLTLKSSSHKETEHLTIRHATLSVTYQLVSPPECYSDAVCLDCQVHTQQIHGVTDPGEIAAMKAYNWTSAHARLDWSAVLQATRRPAQIFDARKVLDRAEMERLAHDADVEVILISIGVPSKAP